MRPDICTRYSLEDKLAILGGLLALRQAGKLQGVWYSDGCLPSVRWVGIGKPEVLTWREAATLSGFKRDIQPVDFRKTLRKSPKRSRNQFGGQTAEELAG